ncbi:MAG: adenylate/guanylate cyclase domain-containing protein [Sphingomonas bacterium]|nr:adenylate/guanylate cyclase domain-containing protein [Sphingomonas bacterium]
MERRLSAIMAADVVGYSRLMGANEVGTLTSLKDHRAGLIDPCIATHQGRIVKLTGDGMLVEFASVVAAVECATHVQREMRERNAEVPEDRRIEFRIGINLGDVIVDDDDLFGDGVNVASRIEGIAKPGGVAVSSAVRDNVGNKLDLVFEDMGDQELKNIEFPVRVYNVLLGAGSVKAANGAAEAELADADKPSIAVLPFNNMSGDPEQEYFSDGITEDIITDLSKVSGLFVIGRNTSFTYKGKAVDIPEIAARLGVKFILEGSVRKAGQRVRVTGQLIDGATGGHVWADRFDRDLTDIFAIQDEITQTIVDQLKIKLLPKEKKAISQAPTANVEAYTYYLKGRQFFHNSTRVLLGLARQMFSKATELDPNYARAYAGIAICDARLGNWYRAEIPTEKILAIADKAISLDPSLAEAHAARAIALGNDGQHEAAVDAFSRALAVDPANFDANLLFARYCVTQSDLERSVPLFERAAELQPDDWQSPLLVAPVLHTLGRPEEGNRYSRLGIKRAEEAMRLHPENSRPFQLGAPNLARLGETERAKEWLERALFLDPEDPIAAYNAACTYAQLGDIDLAFGALDKWMPNRGMEMELWLDTDADFDPLRDDPRFVALLKQLKDERGSRVRGAV